MGDLRPIKGCAARWVHSPTLLLLCLLLVFGWLDTAAATPPQGQSVRFRTISTEQGLSQISATAILEDRNGFLWIGTQDGLNRYDGYRFRVFRHDSADSASLTDNYVLALAEDADGAIWIATQNGLNRFDPDSQQLHRFIAGNGPGTLVDALVIGVASGKDGVLYISTRRKGIQRFQPESQQFVAVPGMPEFRTRQKLLWVNDDGRLIVSNDQDLLEVDPAAAISRSLVKDALPAGSAFLSAVPQPGGGYAAGSSAQGLLLLDAQGQVTRRLGNDGSQESLPDDAVRVLHFDPAGRLWIGTPQGLARLEADGSVSIWRHQSGDPYALPGDSVVALHTDRQGLLWIGTWTGGLARLDPETEQFTILNQNSESRGGLQANAVATVSADPAGGVWLGLIDRGGLVRVAADGTVERSYHSASGPEPRLLSDDLFGVMADAGGVWVGYGRGGVDHFAGDGSVRRFAAGNEPGQLPVSGAMALHVDRGGTLWVGLLGNGVYSLCASCSEFRSWPTDPEGQTGPVGSFINKIIQTSDGVIWFAVRRAGLSWYEPSTDHWGVLKLAGDAEPSLPHDSVTTLLEDHTGQLWLGTQGGGISRIDRDADGRPVSVRSYSEAEGLASSMVGAILDSGDGQLWVSTTRGLCRFHIASEKFECLGDRDPILAVDFFVASAAQDSSGGLHFGSSRGLVSIPRPSKVRFESHQVPLVLTELRIANRPVVAGAQGSSLTQSIEFAQELHLRHDQDLVAIEFAALDLRRSLALHYRYRLRGRDDAWIDTDATRRVATFTGLPFGNYQFEVQALDGAEIVGTRDLHIEVLPAPWLTPWARLGYALLLGGLIAFAGWRYRLRLRERERSQDALAQSEAMLKYSLWGSRGELWDADLRSGKMLRRNRLEHLEATRRASADTLEAYTPFVHEEDRERFRSTLIACVKGANDLFECTYRTRDNDGNWRWLLSRGRVFSRDAKGRAIRMVGTSFDITELRANEDELRQSKDQLNLALWGSGDEMWDIDLATGIVRRENALAPVLLPPETQFPRLMDYMAYVHPGDQMRLREALITHLKGAVDHFECAYRISARDGGWLWVLGKGRVLTRDDQGRAIRLVGTNRDISQLKQVEGDLRKLNDELEIHVQRRTEALEQTNAELKQTLDQLTRAQRQLVESEKLAALGGLVAGVAHEINTPLGVGVTAASHLQQETERLARAVNEGRMTRADIDHFIEQAQLSSDLVLRNLDRASQLVRSFKQVAVDQSSEQRRSFKLGEYISEILLSLHPRIKKSRTEVVVECPEDLFMDTYPGALYQIVVNLVMNSLVHGFDEGSAGRIEISVARADEVVVIDYRDNGRGMSDATRKRVFEPFFTTRRGSGGSGLGLHIVYNLATQILRGTVSCDSELGRGTHFRLVVPQVAPTNLTPAEGIGK
jgi:ligand-binding sensor domain-containing protein/signal transduction histidine kinase